MMLLGLFFSSVLGSLYVCFPAFKAVATSLSSNRYTFSSLTTPNSSLLADAVAVPSSLLSSAPLWSPSSSNAIRHASLHASPREEGREEGAELMRGEEARRCVSTSCFSPTATAFQASKL